MNKLSYGTRNCIVCFKPFAPKYASQVACSEICRKTRRTKLKIASAIRNRDLPWEELEWTNCQLEEAIAKAKASSRPAQAAERDEKRKEKSRAASEKAKPISVIPSKDPYGEPEIIVKADAVAASAKSETAPEPRAKNRDQFAKKYRHICANCGGVFKSERKDDKYCCDQCVRESAPCGVV